MTTNYPFFVVLLCKIRKGKNKSLLYLVKLFQKNW
jgi:hypothetical protein